MLHKLFGFIFLGFLINAQAQDTLVVSSEELRIIALEPNGRIQVHHTKTKSPLPEGLYKRCGLYRDTTFHINKSGLMEGEEVVYDRGKPWFRFTWENGLRVGKAVYETQSGRLMEEEYTSLAKVYLFNPKTLEWSPSIRKVEIQKIYEGNRNDTDTYTVKIRKDSTSLYAIYQYVKGILRGKNNLHYKEELFNAEGKMVQSTVYNWKLKRTETFRPLDSTLLLRTSNQWIWNPDGTLTLAPESTPESSTTEWKKSGKIFKKEKVERNRKTILSYNEKGEIVGKTTKKISVKKSSNRSIL